MYKLAYITNQLWSSYNIVAKQTTSTNDEYDMTSP